MTKLKLLVNLFFFLLLIACYRTNNNDNLIGYWAPGEEENVKFIITPKNIKYFEDNYLYTYKIKQNVFSLMDSGHLIANYEIILLTKDSLVWKTEEGDILSYIKR